MDATRRKFHVELITQAIGQTHVGQALGQEHALGQALGSRAGPARRPVCWHPVRRGQEAAEVKVAALKVMAGLAASLYDEP